MIVEARHDRQIVADNAADTAQQLTFAVLGILGDHGAVQVEIDRIEGAVLAQVLVEQLPHALVGILSHVRGRRGGGPGQRHDLVAEFRELLYGTGDRDVVALDARDHLGAAQKRRPGIGADKFLPSGLLRRKRIGLVLKTTHCYSRHRAHPSLPVVDRPTIAPTG